MKINHNGVTEPSGFYACGRYTGMKYKRRDLAIVYSNVPAKYAAVFTTNRVKAASVIRNKQLLNDKSLIQAIVINSGHANSCTGEQGIINNQRMAESLASALKLDVNSVLTASTGVIGVQLPVDIISEGIEKSCIFLSDDRQGAIDAASAIMTTDTVSKEVSLQFTIGKKLIKIGAMAKGSGMIHPNMATMLAFITTDLNISQSLLQKAMSESIIDTYNMISVDGDTSTNDMACILANGLACNDEIIEENEDYQTFSKALNIINIELAKMIIKDGEGATKTLETIIKGAKTKDDARLLCKSIINSNLVKTAFFGEDANWGRIICAMGYSGAYMNPEGVSLMIKSRFGSIRLVENGIPLHFNEELAAEVLKGNSIEIQVNLLDGDSEAKGWGCDMSYDYIRINGDYRT
ncbi:MAG: bifunctional ornithine acetyltransferase/N-acetylglutamate synthase [Dethiosulfatibacter sp.]|nr:bifunctional ornithine acetyltransferase/N-acetylglutamate synthase [Dethiosulfatibacter sp.]